MDYEKLVLYAVAAISTIWLFMSTKGWAFFTSRQAKLDERQARIDQLEEKEEEYKQQITDASLAALANQSVATSSNVISTNQALVHFLTVDFDKKLGEIVSQLDKLNTRYASMHGVMVRLEASDAIKTREWSRITEIHEDIDHMFEEIKRRIEEKDA